LHIAITFSVIGAVVAEFAGAANGLGYLIQFSSSQLQTALVFASLILISVVGMVFYYAISAVELLVARRFPREEAQLVAP
ncbi:MAG: ABC transporter permease, partial [Vicinamibacteria bacterium]